jgi:transposase-like protein
MENKAMSEPKTLQEAILYFANPVNCRKYLVARRWPDGVICPRCGKSNVLFLEKYNRWHCREKHDAPQFTLKTGTIFEDSPISLDKWLMAMWMIVNSKNGVSSWEIHRAIKVTQKSAWFMLQRIRLGMKNQNAPKLGGSDAGPVEADETFVGPNPMRMHKSRRVKLAAIASERGEKYRSAGKTIVMGMLDREMRQVRAMVVPNVKRATLQEKILNNVEGGSHVITDDFPTYRYALADKFAHDVINHATSYVEGQVHTNGIENFWSLLKRSLRGTYVAVEPFHLDRYIDEQVFRFNNRGTKDNPLNDSDRFDAAVRQIVGKRLTYAELTGKGGETTPF